MATDLRSRCFYLRHRASSRQPSCGHVNGPIKGPKSRRVGTDAEGIATAVRRGRAATAHRAAGVVFQFCDSNFTAAEAQFSQALELGVGGRMRCGP